MLKKAIYIVALTTMLFADETKEVTLRSKDLIEKNFEIVVVQNSSPVERSKPLLQIICHDEDFGCFNSGIVIHTDDTSFNYLFDAAFMKQPQEKRLLSIKTEYKMLSGEPYTQLVVNNNVADNYTFEEIKSYLNMIEFSGFNTIIANWKKQHKNDTMSKTEKRSTWR